MKRYFTDRENGVRPRESEELDERVWRGLQALISGRLSAAAFGYRFPEQCPDGYGACGCDERAFRDLLAAEARWDDWPISSAQSPDTFAVLDLLEFCAASVGSPIEGHYHSFFRHNHLSWDRDAGLKAFVQDVNLLFSRNGMAFELTAEGVARRILPQDLQEAVASANFVAEDAETNRLLEQARRLIVMPRHDDRKDALEKLWDGFERLKTLEEGKDKKASSDALLDRVALAGTRFRQELQNEAMALTRIGNEFRIRHSERDKEELTGAPQVDYLFARMFAFVRLLMKATGRGN